MPNSHWHISADELNDRIIEKLKHYMIHEFGEIPEFLKYPDRHPLDQIIGMCLNYCLFYTEKSDDFS